MRMPSYPPEAVRPMREELVAVGFQELLTAEDVDKAIKGAGTTLCVINSVCGCAAGGARPGVALALQNKVIPDRIVTVFAGMEHEAVARVRELHAEAAPASSPSMALFKDGHVVAMVQRHDIEGRPPQELASGLAEIFDRLCTKPGPSIPPEKFAGLDFVQACGSRIPRRE